MSSHILVVDDEPDIRQLVQEILQDEGYRVSIAKDAKNAREACSNLSPDLVLLDIWMPDEDGITLLKEWKQTQARTFPVVMMSGHGTVETAVEATRLGACDFVEKPLSLAKLLLVVEQALATTDSETIKQPLPVVEELLGSSHSVLQLRKQAQEVANQDLPILISGEIGAGKRSLARYIHTQGQRAHGQFIDYHHQVANELEVLKQYLSDSAGPGGTLYIEDLLQFSQAAQALLLKHLQSSKAQSFPNGWRLIAAAPETIEQLVQTSGLREDVYFRMNGIRMRMPPLRERREDIPLLTEHFVNQLVEKQGLSYRRFNVAAQNRLRNYHWPGNVGELHKLVQQLMVFGSSVDVELAEIEQAFTGAEQKAADAAAMTLPLDLPLRQARESFERLYLQQQLQVVEGNMNQLAKRTGMERTHLYRKLRSLGIEYPKTKS